MALFGTKKGKTTTRTAGQSAPPSVASIQRDLSSVLLKPRITEKAAGVNGQNTYVFIVRSDATKYDVRDAVQQLFSVTPRKVTMVTQAPRRSHSRARGREVVVPGMKKAYVFLKKGERIDLI